MGVESLPILTTRRDAVLAWGQKNSLWPMPFGTACCAIEFMSVVSSVFDISRFGAELVRFSPRHRYLQASPHLETDLRTNVRPQMGYLNGCLRFVGRFL